MGKDDFIYGLRLIDLKHGIADRARNDLAVRQLKLEILFAPLATDRLQYRRVDPRGLSTRIDHQPPHGGRLGSCRIENPAPNVEESHVSAMIAQGIRAPQLHGAGAPDQRKVGLARTQSESRRANPRVGRYAAS